MTRPSSERSTSCTTLSQFRASGSFSQRYEILSTPVGTGAFALVRCCRDRITGKTWAVKIMAVAPEPDERVASHVAATSSHSKQHDVIPETSVEDIHRELRILASLRNQGGSVPAVGCNALQLHEFYEEPHPTHADKKLVYIVTEYLAGGDLLSAVVERGSLAEEDARSVFRSLLQCCVDLQSRRVIHRDIKLDNIMLNSPHDFHNGVTLIDFGLATDVSLSGPPTRPCGTPLSTAPEIVRAGIAMQSGKTCAYGHEADMWSAGVALYTILSGLPVFQPVDFSDLYTSILHGTYNFRDPAWHMVSDSAKDLVVKCLTVDPKERITAREALQHPWLHE